MSLARYRAKRRLDVTPEPSGGAHEGAPIFVVQLHHASHRHYDFRLQVGGVLRSWAVPKGPSFDPKVNRLAMEVEDHPLDYAKFEGTIPEGNYGAGDVRIFDYGTWSTDGDPRKQLSAGHLRFALAGDKLRGSWDLVRTSGRGEKKPRWLLKKRSDDDAGPFEADDLLGDPSTQRKPTAVWHSNRSQKSPRDKARPSAKKQKKKEPKEEPADEPALPIAGATRATIDAAAFPPELARRVDHPPKGDDWIHEPKWDGYRLLAAAADGKVRLWSRNALEWTDRVPEIAAAVESLGARSLRLDGELVAIGPRGQRADFNALQSKLAGEGKARLRYVVFDVLHVEGVDLSQVALVDRKRVLSALLARPHDDVLVEGAVHRGTPDRLFARAVKSGHEGLVSKRADSPYLAGRNGDWVKVRSHDAEELAIVGYTDPRGTRRGVGALLLGRPDKDGGWVYAGRVGTGMSAKVLGELAEAFRPLLVDEPPITADSHERARKRGDLRGAHWVTPRVAVEVVHHGHGKEGLLRQPAVKAIRYDKTARDLTPEGDRGPITLTHGERVVYPAVGLTKADVFAYYEKMAPRIVAEIARRPLAVVRCTDGVGGACFFQKHRSPGMPKDILGAPIRGAKGETQDNLYIEDAAGLLALVQMGVIELHAWGTHIDDAERADRLVMDLDPAPDVSWSRVLDTAVRVRKRLRKDGLASFVRTTGGKGLHVVVPLEPTAFDEVKAYARAIASELAAASPKELIDTATKSARKGRIYLDYLRNGRGATSVASYSLRRTPTATVATPLSWPELAQLRDPQVFDLRRTLASAVARRDPWAGLERAAAALPRR